MAASVPPYSEVVKPEQLQRNIAPVLGHLQVSPSAVVTFLSNTDVIILLLLLLVFILLLISLILTPLVLIILFFLPLLVLLIILFLLILLFLFLLLPVLIRLINHIAKQSLWC